MLRIKSLLLLVLIFAGTSSLFSQSAHKLRLEGDKYFDKQEFGSAEVEYKKARQKQSDFKSNFNIGNSLISQNRYEEALESYISALKSSTDSLTRSKVFHNMGNAYYNLKDYEKSIDSYKNALRTNPDDIEARRNLALAKEKLIEMSRQKKDKDRKENDQNNNDSKDQQNKEGQKDQNEEKKQESDQKSAKLSKGEMEKLLKNIEADENEIQKRVIKGKGKSEKREKDW